MVNQRVKRGKSKTASSATASGQSRRELCINKAAAESLLARLNRPLAVSQSAPAGDRLLLETGDSDTRCANRGPLQRGGWLSNVGSRVNRSSFSSSAWSTRTLMETPLKNSSDR
jgi:hypothetical protein